MTKIDTKAKNTYFASEAKKAIGISIYTDGYKQGFIAALKECKAAIYSKYNNKERVEAFDKLYKEYENEFENGR